jgi:hypothetical protein
MTALLIDAEEIDGGVPEYVPRMLGRTAMGEPADEVLRDIAAAYRDSPDLDAHLDFLQEAIDEVSAAPVYQTLYGPRAGQAAMVQPLG